MLWVSADATDDIDLFVALEKLDADGDQVFFYGNGGITANDVVSRGWLRVSHRELDVKASTVFRPVHLHKQQLTLTPGEPVEVEIAILPHATTFDPGDTLRVHIQGTPIEPQGNFHRFERRVNKGNTTIHTGGRFDARLVLPRIDLRTTDR